MKAWYAKFWVQKQDKGSFHAGNYKAEKLGATRNEMWMLDTGWAMKSQNTCPERLFYKGSDLIEFVSLGRIIMKAVRKETSGGRKGSFGSLVQCGPESRRV